MNDEEKKATAQIGKLALRALILLGAAAELIRRDDSPEASRWHERFEKLLNEWAEEEP